MSELTRSYTNSDEMDIEVSQEHLDAAVEIKLELQENSPSRRCNWKKHRELMEKQGFYDSDINEGYRCLIKDYQKKTGRLRKVDSYANYVAEGKLEAIKQAVGDMYYQKVDNQQVLRELNKIKKGLTTSALAVEELRNAYIDEIDFTVPHYIYQPKLESSANKGIVIITDWHVGVKVDNCAGNSYNYEIAKKRIEKLKKDTLDYCQAFDITDLEVVGLGDWIEHLYMRKNQSQECEFKKALQAPKAQALILDFIVSLAEYKNVTVELIAGNHDREDGDKAASFDGDNAVVVINEGIADTLKLLDAPRLKFIKSDEHATSIIRDINGKKFKFAHGDRDRGGNKHKMKGHISNDNEFYDCYIHGHLHNFYIQSDDHGRMVIGVGCLMGRNNYSKDIYCAGNASQAFIVVRGNGDILPFPVDLQII
ncbi:hypothetical protein [Priestia aryabhattai]|uniref:hypothetical protein n=1 Tax=Priestia aryabhattai TaxID=412384 RepID=UPI0015F677FF|nr:hypothetical protein [Priestia aryabhattai]